MPSYSIVDFNTTTVKLTEDTRELIYKKVYCSCVSDGDNVIFMAHNLETGLLQQQYVFDYTDCVAPTAASASALVTAINAILNNYAGGGAGVEIKTVTVTVPSPLSEHQATVTDTDCTASSKIIISHCPTSHTDANFGQAVNVFTIPASGQFTVNISGVNNYLLFGQYKLNYFIQ